MLENQFKKGIAALFVATLFWAGTFIFTKVLLNDISTSMLLFVRSAITSTILCIFCFKLINKELSGMLRSGSLWIYGITGVIALFLQTKGLEYTSATSSAFITAFCIVLIPIFKKVLFNTHIPLRFYIAVMTALTGLYLISYGFGRPARINLGDFLSFLCAISYALNIIVLEKVSLKFNPFNVVFFSFSLLALFALFPLFFDPSITSSISKLLSISVATNLTALAVLGSIIPYALMAVGQKIVPAGLSGLVYSFEPVFTAIFAFIFLNEGITSVKVIGGVCIFSSLIIGNKAKI